MNLIYKNNFFLINNFYQWYNRLCQHGDIKDLAIVSEYIHSRSSRKLYLLAFNNGSS